MIKGSQNKLFETSIPPIFYTDAYKKDGPDIVDKAQREERFHTSEAVDLRPGIVVNISLGRSSYLTEAFSRGISKTYLGSKLEGIGTLEDDGKISFDEGVALGFQIATPRIYNETTKWEHAQRSICGEAANYKERAHFSSLIISDFRILTALYTHFSWNDSSDIIGTKLSLVMITNPRPKQLLGITSSDHCSIGREYIDTYWDMLGHIETPDISAHQRTVLRAVERNTAFHWNNLTYVPLTLEQLDPKNVYS